MKTFEFLLQIDAHENAHPAELALAVHQAINYARDNIVFGTDIFSAADMEQVTVRPVELLAALEEARNFIADRSDEWDDEEDHLIRTLDAALAAAQGRFALCSAQGTACTETVLTAAEYADPETRARVEKQCCLGRPDDPLPGTWTDVSGNEACQ